MLRLRPSETIPVPLVIKSASGRGQPERSERSKKVLMAAASRPQQGLHSPKASTPSRPLPTRTWTPPASRRGNTKTPFHPRFKVVKQETLSRLSHQLSTAQDSDTWSRPPAGWGLLVGIWRRRRGLRVTLRGALDWLSAAPPTLLARGPARYTKGREGALTSTGQRQSAPTSPDRAQSGAGWPRRG